MLRLTADSTNLHPQSCFSELVLAESGILGEGYIDMKTAEDQILDFVQVLADHPQEATIKRINGNPVVFEVTVSQKDFIEISSKHRAVQTIAGCMSGLPENQFVVKILEK